MADNKANALEVATSLKAAYEAMKKLTEVYFDIGITVKEINMLAGIADKLDELDADYYDRFKRGDGEPD